jgi:glucosamine-6-phosphate deaminase
VEVVILDDAADVARVGGDVVEAVVRGRDRPVLGLATGSSPVPLYRELIRRHREAGLSFATARAFLLDDYVGLPADHPQRYAAVIRRDLTGSIDLPADALDWPHGDADDLPAECRRYEAAIAAAGGVDLQILGIGADGHLAFNEPGSSLSSRTRVKTLTARTREDNARFFSSVAEVPHHVVTQGLGTILQARHLLMVAVGEAKAGPVARALEGPVSAACPASILQLHERATVLLDPAAAKQLEHRAHYEEVWAARPAWQTWSA